MEQEIQEEPETAVVQDRTYTGSGLEWVDPNSMIPRFGVLMRFFARRYFDSVRVDPEDLARSKNSHDAGAVVHILPSLSLLDTLVLNRLFLREGLPLAGFLGGISLLPFWPAFRFFKFFLGKIFGRGHGVTSIERFEGQLRAGGVCLLYAKQPMQFFLGGRNLLRPYVDAVLRVQGDMEKPIFVIPTHLVWHKTPDRVRQTLWDQVFGDPDAPGALRKLVNFVRHSKRAFLRVGEPIDIREFIQKSEGVEARQREYELLRTEILHRFKMERRIFAGPTLRSSKQVREEILRNPDFDQTIYELSTTSGRPVADVRRRAARYLKEIASDFSMNVVDGFVLVLTFAFQRLYTDVHVDRDSLNQLRDIARRGGLVFVPCHRSHVDYLVISYVLYTYGMVPPHIAAGNNLNFWPIGWFFRKGGAFFLRRSFRENPVYAASFGAYVRKLVKSGVSIEFFIEGGRSRTGKCLPPRYGLLKELVAAQVSGATQELYIVPVGLSYEKIIEDMTYSRELAGAKKEKEGFGTLLKTPAVLTDRFGRLTVKFGTPINLKEEVAPFESPSLLYELNSLSNEMSPRLQLLLKKVAYRTLDGINSSILATPTAFAAWALLAHPFRGLRRDALMLRVGFLIAHLKRSDLPLAPTLQVALDSSLTDLEAARDEVVDLDDLGPEEQEYGAQLPYYREIGKAVVPMIDEALGMFERSGNVEIKEYDDVKVYQVVAKNRAAMDYYKNTIMHAFAQEGLLAAALLHAKGAEGVVSKSAVETDCAILSRLLKYEFIYGSGKSFAESFEDTWVYFKEMGWVESEGDIRRVSNEREPVLRFLKHGVLPFIEAYHLACICMKKLKEPELERDFLLSVVAEGHKLFEIGDLQLREACSTATIRNALRVLRELGVVHTSYEGKKPSVSLADGSASEILDEFAAQLKSWCVVINQ